MQQFHGSDEYIASDELIRSVNIAAALKKPLLIKGEPGTGKTMLAEAIARSLDMELLIWNIKSTTRAQDGLYVYDTVQRLYDSQFGADRIERNHDVAVNHIILIIIEGDDIGIVIMTQILVVHFSLFFPSTL